MKLRSVIFAAAIDKETARQQWNDRFNNRAPAARNPGKVEVRASSANPDTTEIMVYDEIGYWGTTAKEFNEALAGISTSNITVRLNSPGGDVFDGHAIYNALQAHPASITCQVDGLAASAASIIALAGNKVVMADNALLMCHCAWSFAFGNKSNMLETASVLEKIDAKLAGIYSKKSGKSVNDCLAMMAGEGKNDGTWFTAEEAKAFGLIDEISGSDDEEDPSAAEAAMMQRIQANRRRLAIAERD